MGSEANPKIPHKMPILTVQYTVLKDNKVIFNSNQDSIIGIDNKKLENTWLIKFFNDTYKTTVTDDKGMELFKLEVKFNPI